MKEAEANKEADNKRKEALKDFGDKVPEDDKEEIEKLTKKVKDALEGDDTDEIKEASEELSKKVMDLSSKVYQNQNEEAARASENASSDDEDEEKTEKKSKVKDAEFEEK